MKVSVEKPSSYQRVLTIEVPSETVDAEIENIYSRIDKTATHPGFRKGKVPRKIIEKKFGKSVRLEAVESTVSSSLKKALEEQKLTPLTDPDFDDVKFEDEGPLSFKATIEIEPTVELGDYKELELKCPKAEVTDEDVARVLERLRLNNAKYTPAERSVEKGDIVIIDFEGFKDGKPVKGVKAENFPLEVGSNVFGEDFENELVGAGKDNKKQITVAYPEDFRTKELAGKEITFAVTVKDVKVRQLPDLDDDFAKDLGEYDTLDKLKQHVRENLEKDLRKRIDHFVREQALMKVVTDSKAEIPPKLRSKVAASIFEEEVKKLAYRGADREALTAERDKIAEFAEAEAARQLKVTFVTDAIARQENLDVSDEELNQSLEETIKESEQTDPRVRSYLNSERVRERYREQLRVGKILDFIVSSAKIEEVDQAAGGAASAPTPGGEEEGES